ncbi:MAG TPA: hypothetical protein VKU80_14345 [Planctomycetota bacterium]|nr:hypothetical protein [Planctomycetota bacterium]
MQIEQWIRFTFLFPGVDVRKLCHRFRNNVALPGGHVLDFVSVHHHEPPAPGAPHLFAVNLWKCASGPVKTETVSAMSASLLVVRTGYAQILEQAECRGRRRRHRFTVQGHIIGPSFERNRLIDSLSVMKGEVVFWTFNQDNGRFTVEPYFIDEDVEHCARLLEEVLDHLAWDKSSASPDLNSEPGLLTPLEGMEENSRVKI